MLILMCMDLDQFSFEVISWLPLYALYFVHAFASEIYKTDKINEIKELNKKN